jgi:hypothetical protein
MDSLKTWFVPLVMVTIACGVLPTDDGSAGMAEAPAAMADDTGPNWLLGPHPVPGSTVPGQDTVAFGIAWSVLVDAESAGLAVGVSVSLDGRDVSDEAIIMATRDYPPSSYTVLVPFHLQPGDHQVLVHVLGGESVLEGLEG